MRFFVGAHVSCTKRQRIKTKGAHVSCTKRQRIKTKGAHEFSLIEQLQRFNSALEFDFEESGAGNTKSRQRVPRSRSQAKEIGPAT
jgi:hypothetical protein